MKKLVSLVFLSVLLLGASAEDVVASSCTRWDIRDVCCPPACAARSSAHEFQHADEILRGCMRGLGCGDSMTHEAHVLALCDCEAPK